MISQDVIGSQEENSQIHHMVAELEIKSQKEKTDIQVRR